MTNEFKILWFEDETTWYTMQSKKVANYLKTTYNLKANPKHDTGANFNPDILKTENAYDLILMDYKLAAGNTGEKIIELIRDNSILTDILLYSSEYSKMVDTLVAQSPLIDGVYFADRKNALFEEKLHGIIHKIVRRSEDVVNLRGFFLDNTSDFEVRIKELLKLSWDKLPDNHEELENSIIKEQYKDEIKAIKSMIEKVTEKSTSIQAIEARNKAQMEVVFSSQKRALQNPICILDSPWKMYMLAVSLRRRRLCWTQWQTA